jgi:hypothetical protein
MPEIPCTDPDTYGCDGKNCHVARWLRGQAKNGQLNQEGWDALVQRSLDDPYCVNKSQVQSASGVTPVLRRTP